MSEPITQPYLGSDASLAISAQHIFRVSTSTWLSSALCARCASASASSSVASTESAPQRAALMAALPRPVPRSSTERPATSSGSLSKRSATATPHGHKRAQ
eukprot:CAMPEP_0183371852 /NCGR_PEP_ID=MMETSP0164_2-20130417/106696_1 /TAXON_ID=221442 /ORGANISM="Coccolithus pelagicus ssp braarudi, Strain PLY182g" /LENGTH=100 /DNA_ID=CAMNT_0025548469 /DNA_START=492 /DNA_END=794 /DNA_ORIENTATION=-